MKNLRLALATTIAAASMTFTAGAPAQAQDAYLGTIQYFGFNFCPRGTMPADGRLLPISSYTAVFSLLGTTYGGDGRTTFALPDLRGRVAINQGQGPGLSYHQLGSKGGTETNTLTVANLPNHTHSATLRAADRAASSDSPTGNLLADFPDNQQIYAPPPANVSMSADAIQVGSTGSNQPVNNMQPYLTVNACVVMQGIYPSRS